MTAAVRWRLFFAASFAINLIAFLVVRNLDRPAVHYGAAFDVAVTVPLLYFWLVVRAGLQPAVTMVPLCLLALLRATYVAPGFLWSRPALGAFAELAVMTLLVVRVRRGMRVAQGAGDFMEKVRIAAGELVPFPLAAEAVTTEIAVCYFAFGSWRARPYVPAGARMFRIQSSSAAMIFAVVAGFSVVEGAIVHVVVAQWSTKVAVILSILSAYSTVWLVAVSRSFALRPAFVGDGELVVRNGMLHSLRAPRTKIAAVRRDGFDGVKLKMPPVTTPNVLVEFTEPVTVQGMYGTRRKVTRLALAVDDPEGFEEALR